MNVMVEYLKINKNFITKYLKIVLGKKYNKKISYEFYKTYIEQRYSFIDEQLSRTNIKTEILKKLDKTRKKLISENKELKDLIENTANFYNYILYFDNVINSKNIEKIIMKIAEQKKNITGQEEQDIQKNIKQTYIEYQKEIQNFFQKLSTTKFQLEFEKKYNNNNKEIREVKFKNNVKIPLLYSEYAIEKAMETEPIVEDKCFVEYHLVAKQILSDILKCDTKKEYIVKFPMSILSKKQKTKRLLEIINSTLMQNKVIMKIDYQDFEKNKAEIYKLINQGSKFCVDIQENYKINQNNMKRLEIFTYIIVQNIENFKDTEYKLNLIEK